MQKINRIKDFYQIMKFGKWKGMDMRMNYHCLAIIYTTICNAQCDMCCFDCSPDNKEKMNLEMAKRIVSDVADMQEITTIGLAGGEIFLFYEEIIELIRFIKNRGKKISITTNGFWGDSEEGANKIVKEIKKSGVSYMKISIDKFHEKYIDISSIYNILIACKKHGLSVSLGSTVMKESNGIAHYTKMLGEAILEIPCINYPCYRIGRAKQNYTDADFYSNNDYENQKCKEWHTITVMPMGDVYPCGSCCGIIKERLVGNIGENNIEDLIEKAKKDNIRNLLSMNTAKEMLEGMRKVPDRMYTDICEFCHEYIKKRGKICLGF